MDSSPTYRRPRHPIRLGQVLLPLLLTAWQAAWSQSAWEFRAEKKGIKVYTCSYPESKFKAIKVEIFLQSSLTRMVAVVLDVNTATDWVYATKTATLVRQVSPTELIYYSEIRLPWPMSNRDFIAHLIATQDPRTKVVTIDGPTVAGWVPEKRDIVRVRQSEGKWIITPLGDGNLKVEYTLRTDPGGDIPAWLYNFFVTHGPLESFEKLQQQIRKPAYDSVKLPFITD